MNFIRKRVDPPHDLWSYTSGTLIPATRTKTVVPVSVMGEQWIRSLYSYISQLEASVTTNEAKYGPPTDPVGPSPFRIHDLTKIKKGRLFKLAVTSRKQPAGAPENERNKKLKKRKKALSSLL